MKRPAARKRIIVNLNKLNDEILNLLVEKYPDGYGDKDVIGFKNSKGETVEAVEVTTDDTSYLVKISERLEVIMEEYDEEEGYIEKDLELPDTGLED